MSVPVLVSLGSNLGDREYQLRTALHRLGRFVRLVKVSSIWESEPLDSPTGAPLFHNLAAVGITSLSAEDLLVATMAIETSMGRVRAQRNAPRPIDIDLIFVGSRRVRSRSLVLPHPRYAVREFVLAPVRELQLGWFDAQRRGEIGKLQGEGRVRRLGASDR